MSMPKTVQIVPSTLYFDTQIRERKGGISGETQEQKQQPKHITIDRHPITREENKREREEKRLSKTNPKQLTKWQ